MAPRRMLGLCGLATIGLGLALCVAELVARAVHYGVHERGFALAELAGHASRRLTEDAPAPRWMPTRPVRERLLDTLYGPDGAELLAAFQRNYAADFAALHAEVEQAGAHLACLYVPSPPGRERLTESNRAFFRGLCEDRGVAWLDAGDALEADDPELVYLLPEDEHLSHVGNRRLARALEPWLRARLPPRFRPGAPAPRGPYPRLGDCLPNQDTVDGRGWACYHVKTNGQGLRRPADLVRPKRTYHVLLLGDSFTFGVYLGLEHTYAHMLDRAMDGVTVLNAGVCGYTIVDQLAMFRERARHADPDLVVLQIYDNDLADLLFYMRNRQARDRAQRVYEPSELESRFLESAGALPAPR